MLPGRPTHRLQLKPITGNCASEVALNDLVETLMISLVHSSMTLVDRHLSTSRRKFTAMSGRVVLDQRCWTTGFDTCTLLLNFRKALLNAMLMLVHCVQEMPACLVRFARNPLVSNKLVNGHEDIVDSNVKTQPQLIWCAWIHQFLFFRSRLAHSA